MREVLTEEQCTSLRFSTIDRLIEIERGYETSEEHCSYNEKLLLLNTIDDLRRKLKYEQLQSASYRGNLLTQIEKNIAMESELAEIRANVAGEIQQSIVLDEADFAKHLATCKSILDKGKRLLQRKEKDK